VTVTVIVDVCVVSEEVVAVDVVEVVPLSFL